jgi:hypothetical protein
MAFVECAKDRGEECRRTAQPPEECVGDDEAGDRGHKNKPTQHVDDHGAYVKIIADLQTDLWRPGRGGF